MENKGSSESKQETMEPRKRHGVPVAAAAISLLCVAVVIFLKHPPKPTEPKPFVAQASNPAAPVNTPAEEPSASKTLPDAAASGIALAPENAILKTQDAAKTNKAAKPKAEKVVKDPLSRVALSLVGLDADAEVYWLEAIQDPGLPTSERQDLIDDLNEEGLPDPRHPTAEDLPLLFSRLEILEGLIPWIDGNFEWDEPREDLLNLIALAMGGGHPVN